MSRASPIGLVEVWRVTADGDLPRRETEMRKFLKCEICCGR